MTANTNLIETSWYKLQETGVEFYGEPPSFQEFQEAVLFWVRLNRLTTWVIADLAMYGEKVYGETYAQVVEATGLSLGRISNIVSVARRFPVNERRALPFGHHATVAYMEPDKRSQWLDRAEQEDLTREELRQAIRAEVTIPNDSHEGVIVSKNDNTSVGKEGVVDSGLSKLNSYSLIVEYVRAVNTGLDERAREVFLAMENLVRNSL